MSLHLFTRTIFFQNRTNDVFYVETVVLVSLGTEPVPKWTCPHPKITKTQFYSLAEEFSVWGVIRILFSFICRHLLLQLGISNITILCDPLITRHWCGKTSYLALVSVLLKQTFTVMWQHPHNERKAKFPWRCLMAFSLAATICGTWNLTFC